jgi:hypothetical protein
VTKIQSLLLTAVQGQLLELAVTLNDPTPPAVPSADDDGPSENVQLNPAWLTVNSCPAEIVPLRAEVLVFAPTV